MNKQRQIPIILVTFKRPHLLKKTLEEIWNRTSHNRKVYVVNNGGEEDIETINILKQYKCNGFVDEFVNINNEGLSQGLCVGYEIAKRNGDFEYVVFTQDDLIPPKLLPDWMSRLEQLLDKNEEYGAICMRIQRTRRRHIDEFSDIIPSDPACPAIFRMCRKEVIDSIGFTKKKHWESTTFATKVKEVGYKLGMATHIYCNDMGFMPTNKGFEVGYTDYFTHSPERENQGELQPYPDIDDDTNIPIKINCERDRREQDRREDYYKYWGITENMCSKHALTEEQIVLGKYAKEVCDKGGVCLELGVGGRKSYEHENVIGVDLYHDSVAEIKANVCDLYMFGDESVDGIINSHLLEHLPDTISVLREWIRILKVGGILAIAVPSGERKKRYILRGAHKVNLGNETLRLILKRILKMKVIHIEEVKKNNPSKMVDLIVTRKVS